jgi:hypothetical protein
MKFERQGQADDTGAGDAEIGMLHSCSLDGPSKDIVCE